MIIFQKNPHFLLFFRLYSSNIFLATNHNFQQHNNLKLNNNHTVIKTQFFYFFIFFTIISFYLFSQQLHTTIKSTTVRFDHLQPPSTSKPLKVEPPKTEILNHRKSNFHFQSNKTFKTARPRNVPLPPISNGQDPLLFLASPMTASSASAVPLLHLLPKPHTKSLMSVLAPPCSAMVIGNKYLDFCCVCLRENEREVGKLRALALGNANAKSK